MKMEKRPSIFVQIASFRDPECQWTVKDLFEKAAHPERVFVGICWQFDAEADANCFIEPSPYPMQTRVFQCDAVESGGVGWARAKAQTLYRGEDYVLMIDSHMRFEPGWDETLLAMLALCDSPKPVLSAYPPGYDLPGTPKPDGRPAVMRCKIFLPEGGIRMHGELLKTLPDKPLRGLFIAAGYLFCSGAVIAEVPYDPCTYNAQEEMSLALRLFTHGWDIFHPHRVVIYHLYHNDAPPQKKLHWEDNKDWRAIRARAQRHFDHLTGFRRDLPPEDMTDRERYSLGTKRTLAQFEEYCGVDFRRKRVSDRALRLEFIPDLLRYRAPIHVPEIDGKPFAEWPKGYVPAFGASRAEPLAVGDTLPACYFADAGSRAQDTRKFAGTPTLLCFVPTQFDDYNREFFAAWAQKKDQLPRVQWVFVSALPPAALDDFRERFCVPQEVLSDHPQTLCRAFGIEKSIAGTPFTALLDADQKIVEICCTTRNSLNHLGDITRGAMRHFS